MKIVFAIPGFSTDNRSVEGQRVRRAVSWCASRVGSAKFKKGAVEFSIDRAFRPRASNATNAAALETLLACLVQLNFIWLQFHPGTPGLYQTPVYYERTTVWDTIPALYARGFGDCKSLTAALVAQLRKQGVWCRAVFRHKSQVSATMFHILVMLENGWSDPSKDLGMLSYQEDPSGDKHLQYATARVGFGFQANCGLM